MDAPSHFNSSAYTKALAKLELFESFKKKKHHSTFDPSKSQCLGGVSGEKYNITTGPVLTRGKKTFHLGIILSTIVARRG